MLWLDQKLFGNGEGMNAPYGDERFYWLSGRLYTFSHSIYAQLHSFHWRRPPKRSRIKICGRVYELVTTERRWCRVMAMWRLVHLPKDTDAAYVLIDQIGKQLGYEYFPDTSQPTIIIPFKGK